MKITYKYTDKIWKKEVGPCDPEHLGRAWFKNRINKNSSIFIVELNKSAPLWTIPDFKLVEDVKRREWTKLGVAGAVLLPIVCALAWWIGSTRESPGKEKERRAKEWLSNPDNRQHFNEYMREKRKQKQEQ